MLIAGIDEAGRGPVIGPLVVGCVVFDTNILKMMTGLKDSKKLSAKRRAVLYQEILENACEVLVVELSARVLNALHDAHQTLNEMEVLAFSEAFNSIDSRVDEVYLDAADVNAERFGCRVIPKQFAGKVISQHKADDLFPIVSAASIVAKVHRDELLQEIADRYPDENIGSGYPGDKYTRKWLINYYQQQRRFPPDVRKFWKTLTALKNS